MRQVITFLILCSAVATASAIPLSSPPLNANIRNDNGAFNNVSWNEEFFRLGAYVSDYGFQIGNDTTTFKLLSTNGSNSGLVSSVTGSGNTVTASGTYNGTIHFTRTYTIPSGYTNVITVTTEVSNTGTATVDLHVFDTFDPDQGPGASTTNDVIANPGGVPNSQGGIASNGRTVLWATQAPAVLGFGGGTSPFGLGIGNGSALNTFLSSPYDPNNAKQDIGFAIAFTVASLAPGDVASFTYDMIFGNTVVDVLGTYEVLRSGGGGSTVPEPATLALMALGLVGIARRKQQNHM